MKTTMMDPEDAKPYVGIMPVIHEDKLISDDRLSRNIDLLLDPWLEDFLLLPQTSNLTVDDEAAVLEMNLFPDLTLLDDQPIVEHQDQVCQVNSTVAPQQVEGYHHKILHHHHQNLIDVAINSSSWNNPLVDSTKTIKVEDHNLNFIDNSKAPHDQSYNYDDDDDLQLDLRSSSAHVIKGYTSSSTLLRVPQLFPPQVIQPVCDEFMAANWWPVACPAGTYDETLAFVNTGVNNNNNCCCKSDHFWSDRPNLSTLPSFGHDECIGRSVTKPTVHIWSGAMHMMMLPEYI
jgi:hypothetical protein